MISKTTFKSRLAARERLIGCWSGFCSPLSAEMISLSGFDWMLLDMEHSPNDLLSLQWQIHAAAASGGIEPIVRPPVNDATQIKRVMDLGVRTLLIPMIETRAQAEAAIAATRYPPEGIRGVSAGSRTTLYGKCPERLQSANDEACVLLQVETRLALENLEDIVTTKGLDGIFVGPSDLAASFGYIGNPSAEPVQNAMEQVVNLCRKFGLPCGTLAPAPEDAARYLSLGYDFVAVANDVTILRSALEDRARQFDARDTKKVNKELSAETQ
jgi:2-keto-3-deoxy-L-rhamnonate aldolase RhmA